MPSFLPHLKVSAHCGVSRPLSAAGALPVQAQPAAYSGRWLVQTRGWGVRLVQLTVLTWERWPWDWPALCPSSLLILEGQATQSGVFFS